MVMLAKFTLKIKISEQVRQESLYVKNQWSVYVTGKGREMRASDFLSVLFRRFLAILKHVGLQAPLSLRTIRRATMPSPKRLESTFSVRLKFQLHRHGELCESRARKKRKNAGRPSINHVF